MIVIRKQKIETRAFQIGDRIRVGKYTATCQKVADGKAIFLLNNTYAINSRRINEGGYEAFDLCTEFKNIIRDVNFGAIRNLLVPFDNGDLMRLAAISDISSHSDGDERKCNWLQNRVINSAAYFALVTAYGAAAYYGASDSGIGVRPVFQLVSL